MAIDKVQCRVTAAVLDTRYMRKTEDNEWVKASVYNTASLELQKGLLTLGEIQEAVNTIKFHSEKVTDYMVHMRKHAKHSLRDWRDIQDEYSEYEHAMSLMMFSKYPCCLTKLEHVAVMIAVMNEHPAPNVPIVIDFKCGGEFELMRRRFNKSYSVPQYYEAKA